MPQLIQAGLWTDSYGNSSPFWEAISSGYDTGLMFKVPAPPQVTYVGDSINTSVTYTSTQIVFAWHDLSTGAVWQEYAGSAQLNGNAPSNFYNGSTGEAIDERGKFSGYYSALRNYGTDNWSSVKVSTSGGSLTNIRLTPHYGIDMVDLYYVFSRVSEPNGDTGTFTDTWNSCGVYGAP